MNRAFSAAPLLLLLFSAAGCDSEVEDGTGSGGGPGSGGGSTTSAGEGGSGSPSSTDASTAEVSSSASGSGGADVCPLDPPHEPSSPPGRPEGAPAGDGSGVLLGVSRWYLGDIDRDGAPSPAAWQYFGYDVDGVNTVDRNGDGLDTADLVCVCAPAGGAIAAPDMEDGFVGTDNSFGKNVVPLLAPLFEEFSGGATDAVEAGVITVAFDLTTLGAGADYDPVATRYYQLRNGQSGTWQYAPESLQGGDPASPVTSFPTAYVTGNTWVSAPVPQLEVPFLVAGARLLLTVHDAVVSMDLEAGGHESAEFGTISGTLDAEELIASLGDVLAALGGGDLCPGSPVFESIAQNIRNASDILADGTQATGVPCGGITVGLGFDAVRVEVADVAEPLEPPPNECE